jgi:hypothetical protein
MPRSKAPISWVKASELERKALPSTAPANRTSLPNQLVVEPPPPDPPLEPPAPPIPPAAPPPVVGLSFGSVSDPHPVVTRPRQSKLVRSNNLKLMVAIVAAIMRLQLGKLA